MKKHPFKILFPKIYFCRKCGKFIPYNPEEFDYLCFDCYVKQEIEGGG